jgi:hypothetical protein
MASCLVFLGLHHLLCDDPPVSLRGDHHLCHGAPQGQRLSRGGDVEDHLPEKREVWPPELHPHEPPGHLQRSGCWLEWDAHGEMTSFPPPLLPSPQLTSPPQESELEPLLRFFPPITNLPALMAQVPPFHPLLLSTS